MTIKAFLPLFLMSHCCAFIYKHVHMVANDCPLSNYILVGNKKKPCHQKEDTQNANHVKECIQTK